MRTYIAVILFASLCSASFAQQAPCRVTLGVTIPDLSSLPKADADAMVAEWKRNLQAKKYELRDGSWDQGRELRDFIKEPIPGKRWYFVKELGGTTLPQFASVENLPPSAFSAQVGSRVVPIQSATMDRGPRRMVFVVENGKRMTPARRKIVAAVITEILSMARAEDSFAFLTAGGIRLALPLGITRDAIRVAAEALPNATRGDLKGEPALDAVMEAITWLQPPQVGDSIFVLAPDLENKRHVGFSKVRDALAAGAITLLGIQLGEISEPNTQEEFPDLDSFLSIPQSGFGNVDHFLSLALGSGGVAIQEDTGRNKYALTDERLKELRHQAGRMYKSIKDLYVLQVNYIGPHARLSLTVEAFSALPWAMVSLPKYLPPCSNTTTAAPAQAETTK